VDIKIIGIIAVIVVLFSVNQCGNDKNSLSSTGVEGSTLDMSNYIYREEKFSEWLPRNKYQAMFKSKYFKKHKTYPAYVEMDTLGNRRMIEISYEPRFYWYVTSGRTKEAFQKIHLNQTLNKSKKLLSLYVIKKDGINVYAGVWISEDVFNRESEKLQKYGITPPIFVD